ncbi:MAG: MerR family transcriptional regulator [Lachnospiraceae bacterium]
MNTYTIRDLSLTFDLPSSTLRYYEDIGLLTNVSRNASGQRVYTDEHINRLRAIECFKRTGLPIAKMLDFFHYEENLPAHIDDIVSLVTEHESYITEQIQKMQDDLKHIRHKVWFYHAIQKAIETRTEWPKWEDYPPED